MKYKDVRWGVRYYIYDPDVETSGDKFISEQIDCFGYKKGTLVVFIGVRQWKGPNLVVNTHTWGTVKDPHTLEYSRITKES